MFDAEESLAHLQEMRRKAAAVKGEAVEGLTPIVLEEENKKNIILTNFNKKKSVEINP